jgi:hypothetical protein
MQKENSIVLGEKPENQPSTEKKMKFTIMNEMGPVLQCDSYEECDGAIEFFCGGHFIWEGTMEECQIKFDKLMEKINDN